MANEIEKLNTIAIADIEKFNGKTDNNIEKLNAFEFVAIVDPLFAGTRAVIAGGDDGTSLEDTTNVIGYKTITTDGNTADFGDLVSARGKFKGAGSNISRGVWVSGRTDGYPNTNTHVTDMDFVTVGSTGNATDFGNCNVASSDGARDGSSNGTLLFSCGGFRSGAGNQQDDMEYITIASTGNGTNAGDLMEVNNGCVGTHGNTRYLVAGGYDGGAAQLNRIQYNDFSTSADCQDFGDLTAINQYPGSASSVTRACIWLSSAYSVAGGGTLSIDFVTVASTGNASDFGDKAIQTAESTGTSNGTRGELYGGEISGGEGGSESGIPAVNVIQKITIDSAGDATNIGDLTVDVKSAGALSGT
tara:strand:- start:4887 stop:5966 length:1080 start_codon:yes stop_codon:yes gene_type:complete